MEICITNCTVKCGAFCLLKMTYELVMSFLFLYQGIYFFGVFFRFELLNNTENRNTFQRFLQHNSDFKSH